MNQDDKTVIAPKGSNNNVSNASDTTLIKTTSNNSADATLISKKPSHRIPPKDIQPSLQSASAKKIIKGRFELINLLGSGGMGAVYKALDRRKVEASDSNPYVAVKVLNSDFRQHPDAFISLQRESRKSQTLAHPNIVTVYDFDRDQDLVFMTMEFLEGLPLDELLRGSPKGLATEQAQSILRDISNALSYAHSHKIIHSDFKPGNIFVTKNNGTKVFDFGIARAVSSGSAASQAGDKTIFDASTLGALTPAYASYEMLTGKEPSASDDVYALGCVAYELFSGRHPFDKTPADKALSKKLKPKRLKNLSRRQWKAISSALEFTRDKRTSTTDEFFQTFFGSAKVIVWALTASLAALATTGAVYYQQQQQQAEKQQQLQLSLQAEMAQQLEESTLNNQRKTIERLLQISALTAKWDSETRKELLSYEQLAPEDHEFIKNTRHQVAKAYLERSKELLEKGDLDNISTLLRFAQQWGADTEKTQLLQNQVITLQEAERLRIENARLAEAQKAAEELKAEQELIRQAQIRQEVARLDQALRCSNQIDIANSVTAHLHTLEALAPERKTAMRSSVASSLISCFDKVKLESPFAAQSLLNNAQTLLPEQMALKKLKIDYCAHLPAGSGKQGRRYACADPLAKDLLGPSMVVIPSPKEGEKIAISQYEISYNDLAAYCEITELCDAQTYRGNFLPVHNINFEFANNFAHWLSQTTGLHYRIPDYNEWFIAAKADGSPESTARNCSLEYGALTRGKELLSTHSDNLNAYGVASIVGNVQEWALRDNELVAAGGSRITPMYECRYTQVQPHSGLPDNITGFRLARNLLY